MLYTKPGWKRGPGRTAGSRNKATLALDAIGNEAGACFASHASASLLSASEGGRSRLSACSRHSPSSS
jgi:hypothetical protein